MPDAFTHRHDGVLYFMDEPYDEHKVVSFYVSQLTDTAKLHMAQLALAGYQIKLIPPMIDMPMPPHEPKWHVRHPDHGLVTWQYDLRMVISLAMHFAINRGTV